MSTTSGPTGYASEMQNHWVVARRHIFVVALIALSLMAVQQSKGASSPPTSLQTAIVDPFAFSGSDQERAFQEVPDTGATVVRLLLSLASCGAGNDHSSLRCVQSRGSGIQLGWLRRRDPGRGGARTAAHRGYSRRAAVGYHSCRPRRALQAVASPTREVREGGSAALRRIRRIAPARALLAGLERTQYCHQPSAAVSGFHPLLTGLVPRRC